MSPTALDRIVNAQRLCLVQDPRVPKPGPPPIPAESKVLHILRMLAVARSTMLSKKGLCAMGRLSKLCASNRQALGRKVSLIGLWITS